MSHEKRRLLLVLWEPPATAAVVADLLEGLLPEGCLHHVVVPPVLGVRFFADASVQPQIDRWWAETIQPHDDPIYLFEHDDDLIRWLPGVDGRFMIRGDASLEQSYRSCDNVVLIDREGPLQFVHTVVERLSPASVVEGPAVSVADAGVSASAVARIGTSPFEALAAIFHEPLDDPRVAPPDAGRPVSVEGRSISRTLPAPRRRLPPLRSPSFLRRPAHVLDGELTRILCEKSPLIVAVGSRKGGVGKTTHTAGVAVAAGEALDRAGRRAAIVDANLANPDAWGQMSLPAGSATVRQVIEAICAGREPPRPVHATTPALACYPESREGAEYSRTEIMRFAAYLRRTFSFTVIDLCNRLPDVAGGAEASVAAYWLVEADVVVLPTASSKQEFNGVLDYLDLPDLPPAIVAYINPRSRQTREHPLTKQYLQAIAARARDVVPLPDEADRVRYAVLEGLPVQDASDSLRLAYRKLTMAIAAAR